MTRKKEQWERAVAILRQIEPDSEKLASDMKKFINWGIGISGLDATLHGFHCIELDIKRENVKLGSQIDFSLNRHPASYFLAQLTKMGFEVLETHWNDDQQIINGVNLRDINSLDLSAIGWSLVVPRTQSAMQSGIILTLPQLDNFRMEELRRYAVDINQYKGTPLFSMFKDLLIIKRASLYFPQI